MAREPDCPADDYFNTFELDGEPAVRKAYKPNKNIRCKYCGKEGLQWHSEYDNKTMRTVWRLYELDPVQANTIRLHGCDNYNKVK